MLCVYVSVLGAREVLNVYRSGRERGKGCVIVVIDGALFPR